MCLTEKNRLRKERKTREQIAFATQQNVDDRLAPCPAGAQTEAVDRDL